MRALKLVSGALSENRRNAARLLGRRFFSDGAAAAAAAPSASTEAYAKRNYANNVSEYNTVVDSVSAQRRFVLLRDVYDDMMLDGVRPSRDTFHSFIVAAFKGSRMQDAFFFSDQMKSMGLAPDVSLYNMLISLCGKCNNADQAIKIWDEMKIFEVKPTVETYICLLNTCATEGRLDRVYAIIRDMSAAGLALNKFCYAGLITAYKTKKPLPEDFATKIIEFVERSKEGISVADTGSSAENIMMDILPEELYNLPTAEYAHRRSGFLFKPLTVYHAAFQACADLKNVEVTETLLEMLEKEGITSDIFILMQLMRCYLGVGDLDRGIQIFEEYMKTDKPPVVELYLTLIEGAMNGYTPRGMQIAQETLEKMNSRNFFLNPKGGSDLLLLAAGEKGGGYIMANYIWDLLQARNITPFFNAVEAYYKGLKERDIPGEDPRLQHVSRTYEDLRMRFGNTSTAGG